NEVGTSYVNSSGSARSSQGGKIGVSGDVNVLTIDNAGTAFIADGAQVNQHFTTPPAGQDVKVEAFAGVETVNFAEQISLLNFITTGNGGSGGDAAFGGSFEDINYDNAATAYIDDHAKVSAGHDVTVTSNTSNYLLIIAQSGGLADKLGVDGAFSFG